MTTPPPNIVFLHSHNVGIHIQPYGFAMPTPRLQQLAEQGVMFRRAFCVSPTCSPSRASFMTGQWPHTNGMYGLAHRGFRLHDYQRTLVSVLNQAGYQTVLAGLQHFAPKAQVIGYSRVTNPPPRWLGRDVAARAVEFLRGRHDRPFFLDVGIFEAHRPYPDPAASGIDARYMRPPANVPDTPQTRHDAAGLAASVRDMDTAFGMVLDALDQTNLADNTLVICLTDHGLQWPGHMCTLYDGGLQTFMILRGPGGFTGGKVIDGMVTQIDLFPTICDLAGIQTPPWVQGRSLLPLIQAKVDRLHEEIFGEVNFHAAYEPLRCVRTERWKYIRRYLGRSRPILANIDTCPTRDVLVQYGLADRFGEAEELYDLIFDPLEQHNLAGDARYAQTLADMRRRLEAWMARTEDPLLAGPLTPPPGAQVNHPDALHPMDRLETIP